MALVGRKGNSINNELEIYIDSKLRELFVQFSSNNKPIQVNFRELVSWVPYSESFTHYIHQYPAKLLKHIPIFFLNSKILNPKKGGVVLDPFCGTGTVLLEANLSGFKALGCDANPIARLIAKVKTKSIDSESLKQYLVSVTKRAKQFRAFVPKNVINVDHWFPKKSQIDLSKLSRAIEEVKEKSPQRFFISYSIKHYQEM